MSSSLSTQHAKIVHPSTQTPQSPLLYALRCLHLQPQPAPPPSDQSLLQAYRLCDRSAARSRSIGAADACTLDGGPYVDLYVVRISDIGGSIGIDCVGAGWKAGPL